MYTPRRVPRKTEMSQVMPSERTDKLHNGKLRGNNTMTDEIGLENNCLFAVPEK